MSWFKIDEHLVSALFTEPEERKGATAELEKWLQKERRSGSSQSGKLCEHLAERVRFALRQHGGRFENPAPPDRTRALEPAEEFLEWLHSSDQPEGGALLASDILRVRSQAYRQAGSEDLLQHADRDLQAAWLFLARDSDSSDPPVSIDQIKNKIGQIKNQFLQSEARSSKEKRSLVEIQVSSVLEDLIEVNLELAVRDLKGPDPKQGRDFLFKAQKYLETIDVLAQSFPALGPGKNFRVRLKKMISSLAGADWSGMSHYCETVLVNQSETFFKNVNWQTEQSQEAILLLSLISQLDAVQSKHLAYMKLDLMPSIDRMLLENKRMTAGKLREILEMFLEQGYEKHLLAFADVLRDWSAEDLGRKDEYLGVWFRAVTRDELLERVAPDDFVSALKPQLEHLRDLVREAPETLGDGAGVAVVRERQEWIENRAPGCVALVGEILAAAREARSR